MRKAERAVGLQGVKQQAVPLLGRSCTAGALDKEWKGEAQRTHFMGAQKHFEETGNQTGEDTTKYGRLKREEGETRYNRNIGTSVSIFNS